MDNELRFVITQKQLEEMVRFMKEHTKTEFYSEIMNDGACFLSCTFFRDNYINASGFWELPEVE